MAVVDTNSNEWINSDGLKVLFANDAAFPQRGGEYSQLDAGRHCVEVNIDLTQLIVADEKIIVDNVSIPAGAFIEEVELFVTEAATGSSSTLDVGLVRQDFTTEVDFNGFVEAETLANLDAAGAKTTYVRGLDGAVTGNGGELIGTSVANTGYIVAGAGTAVFTDGTVRVRIFYIVPHSTDL